MDAERAKVVVLTVVLAVAGIAVYMSSRTDPADEREREESRRMTARAYKPATQPKVRYSVDGTAKTASLTYTNESGGTEQQLVTLPWTLEFYAKRGQFVYLSAQSQHQYSSINAAIYSDGQEIQKAQSSGDYVIASASGAVK